MKNLRNLTDGYQIQDFIETTLKQDNNVTNLNGNGYLNGRLNMPILSWDIDGKHMSLLLKAGKNDKLVLNYHTPEKQTFKVSQLDSLLSTLNIQA